MLSWISTCLRFATIIALLIVNQAAWAAVDRNAFVAGWPIELSANGTFFDVPLTEEIYRRGRSLDELAVLDQSDQPMPFYRVEVSSPVIEEERTTLSVSPIYVREDDGGGADISVATDDGRTDVTVTRTDDDAPELEVAAFIVDARNVESIPLAIELEWRGLDRPFLMSVSVEHSESLTGWRRVGRSSIAALAIDNAAITHGRVPMSGREGGYYRVTWDRRVTDWQLERVVLISSRQTETATFGAIDVPPFELAAEQAIDNALYFDTGGTLPVISVDLRLPGDNSWANAGLHWAHSIDGPWRQASVRRLFYQVEFETERFASAPIDLGRTEARYWRATFSPEIPADGIELHLEYPEESLRFSANGAPPYMLVGGTLSDESGPDQTFANVMAALDPDQAQASRAALGARVVLGGEAALELPTEFPWRTILLWVALLAGGLTVGWMAVRLVREMSAKA